ncbi:MAG: dipeptidyl aminopeptidase [Candidatus Glassbacteria bacterium]|nr:dipeptidyl aminopeptidase [Candidatus Glassbacteria bacterium]
MRVLLTLILLLAASADSFAQSRTDTLSGAWPVPLTDILTDYLPANQINGGPVVRTRIDDPDAWASKRESIVRRARELLGDAPPVSGPLEVRVIGEQQREGFLQREVTFNSGTGDRINGWLLIPPGASAAGPRPVILAMHSTITPGAKVTVGIERARDNRYYGEELARRGYVVFAPDVISAGERVYEGGEPFDTGPFDRTYPEWSAMGKMLSDHIRSVDFLGTVPEADTSRLGVIGHSLGGYNAFFHQAFDPRVDAAVSSCGFVSLATSAKPFRFARDTWFVHFNDRLRDHLRSGVVPCDLHEVAALCAPRALFNYSARQDHIFPDFWAVAEPLKQVARLYEILGAADRFETVYTDGDHDFPPEIRERAYQWLDRWLGRDW